MYPYTAERRDVLGKNPEDREIFEGCKIPARGKSQGWRGMYFPIHSDSRQCTAILSALAGKDWFILWCDAILLACGCLHCIVGWSIWMFSVWGCVPDIRPRECIKKAVFANTLPGAQGVYWKIWSQEIHNEYWQCWNQHFSDNDKRMGIGTFKKSRWDQN